MSHLHIIIAYRSNLTALGFDEEKLKIEGIDYLPHRASSTVAFLLIARTSKEHRVWSAYAKLHKEECCPKILSDSEEWRYIASRCQTRMLSVFLVFLSGKN